MPQQTQAVTVKAPDFRVAEFTIRGTAPYVQHRFSKKSEFMDRMKQGNKSKKGAKREPRDFDADYKAAMYEAVDGWRGIPAPAFRNAMISACRTVGYKMTHAKLAVFIEADGFDSEDGVPLVKITKGGPVMHTATVRNDTGVPDVRARPMWREGWEARIRIKFDADMFSTGDVANLLMRVGMQVGVGEGRPDSKDSAGMGWGTFEIVQDGQSA